MTVADLENWTQSGATWRALELEADHVLVELCACTGERVDVLAGAGAELVRFVRERGLSG